MHGTTDHVLPCVCKVHARESMYLAVVGAAKGTRLRRWQLAVNQKPRAALTH